MKNEIRFTLESKQRPKLAQEIGNLLGTAPHYERVPSSVVDIIQALVIIFAVAGTALLKLPAIKQFLINHGKRKEAQG